MDLFEFLEWLNLKRNKKWNRKSKKKKKEIKIKF
jgi:hypothetical protein